MYKRHKITTITVMVIITVISLVFDLDYEDMAANAIIFNVIALVAYMITISVMLGCPYIKKLRQSTDKEIPTKTALGVCSEYLRVAGISSILTITISSLYVLKFPEKLLELCPVLCDGIIPDLACAFSCGMLAINVMVMWLIFKFFIISLINSSY